MELNDIFVGMIPPEDIDEYPAGKMTTTFEEDEGDETNQKVNWEQLEVDEDTPISVLLLFINSLNKRLCELEKQNNLQQNFFKVTPQEEKDEH